MLPAAGMSVLADTLGQRHIHLILIEAPHFSRIKEEVSRGTTNPTLRLSTVRHAIGFAPGLCWGWYDDICWGNIVLGMPIDLVDYCYPDPVYTTYTIL